MSGRLTIVLEGWLSGDPQTGTTQGGKRYASVSLPYQREKYDRETKESEKFGETLWCRATFWDEQADAVAERFSKGDLVLITAQVAEPNAYIDKSGEARASLDLKYATIALIVRAKRAGGYQPTDADAPGAPGQVRAPRGQQAPDDSWIPAPDDSLAPPPDESPF